MSKKLQSAIRLMDSRQYILITEKHSVVEANFKGMPGIMMLSSIRSMISNLEKIFKDIEKKLEKQNGRNTSRGSVGRSYKRTAVR